MCKSGAWLNAYHANKDRRKVEGRKHVRVDSEEEEPACNAAPDR